jgi:cyclophilin family peptidyl-prolyl cis-trans isomerase
MKTCALLGLFATLSIPALCFGQERNPVVIMETSLGTIRLELFADKAPVSVKNFLRYADDKFYEGTVFHRVIPNFMVQGGGLDPDLKTKQTRAPIANEAGNGLSNVRGSLAMARTVQPDSATAQFYINVKDNAFLDRARSQDKVGYAVFGRVLDMEVVDKIQQVATGNRGGHQNVPLEPVVIRSMRRAADLKLVLGGSFAPDKLFTITAYVDYAVQGQTLTLALPAGVRLMEGKETQPVPASATAASVVLWKARVLRPGEYTINVRSSTGMQRSHNIKSSPPKTRQPGKAGLR